MKSDLGTRALTALAMVAVAGVALWLGGWFWAVFVGLIAAGVFWEWRALVQAFAQTPLSRALWNLGGFVYIAVAAFTLLLLRSDFFGILPVLAFVGAVIFTDIGAYFAGRRFGGPKIAPRISPSKTWSGLVGGMIGACIITLIYTQWSLCEPQGICNVDAIRAALPGSIFTGVMVAVTAQAGDFFESWMKRRAGVKDSGKLLPGHGGLFDRVDGLLAVAFLSGLIGGSSVLMQAGTL
ncbi:MAG: phosphatidate cytidylyltransferase [Novosphingobium sp.]|nr:phosphatidate cytidylyltransferase [Novosphingobium sp.]